jgi:hypothetical protein
MENIDKKKLREQYKERKVTGGVFVIKNTITGNMLLQSAIDLQGSRNRFEFSQSTGLTNYTNARLNAELHEHGQKAFIFEVLDALEKKDDQTPKEFTEEVKLLEEMWRERLAGKLY